MASENLQHMKKQKQPAPSANSEDNDENYNDGKHFAPICVINAVPDFTQYVYVI